MTNKQYVRQNLYKIFFEKHMNKKGRAYLKDGTIVEGTIIAINHAHFNVIIDAKRIYKNGEWTENKSHWCFKECYLEIFTKEQNKLMEGK